MKKISKTTWTRYKESAEGKEVIALFEKIQESRTTAEEILEITKRFNPQYFNNIGKKEMAQNTERLNLFLDALGDIGARPIDLHIKGFEKLGATTQIVSGGSIIAQAKELKPMMTY